jgi:hypothetical protein
VQLYIIRLLYRSSAMEALQITREARIFALQELSRRAGVQDEVYKSSNIHVGGDALTLSVNGTQEIFFPGLPDRYWQQSCSGNYPCARFSWMFAPSLGIQEAVPDFVVPFIPDTTPRKPLFQRVNSNTVKCNADLLGSMVLTLSRFEESTPSFRDEHGRFPASASVAAQAGFLDRPVVDEYGLAFEQVLSMLLPGWHPIPRRLRILLSHDIDDVGVPFSIRTAVGHALRRNNPRASLRDLCACVRLAEPAYLEAVRKLILLAEERGIRSAVYWKATTSRTTCDSGYDPRSPKVQPTIRWLQNRGVEQGVHPGYFTFNAPEKLQKEVEIVREALGVHTMGGRQHYLRWTPDSWLEWERLGLLYDSTVGYADRPGFRAGTCVPYHPWSLKYNRRLAIIEVPLIVMERTLFEYMHLIPTQCIDIIHNCIRRCRLVGGVFTLLWHNSMILDPEYRDVYESALDLMAGNESYGCDYRPA